MRAESCYLTSDVLRGADQDALLRAITGTLAADGYLVPPTTRLRAFARRVQRHLQPR